MAKPPSSNSKNESAENDVIKLPIYLSKQDGSKS